MKKYVFLLLMLSNLSLHAQEKKEITLNPEISEVTVFIKGAQVVRETAANFPAGKSTVRFTNLSPYIDAKSVQVKVDGEVMVMSVNHQQNFNDTVKQTEDVEKLQKQIADLKDKIESENLQKEIVNEELTFLRENKKISGNDGINFNNLKATSTYYGERVSALKMKEREIDKNIKSMQEEKSVIERKLASKGNVKPETTGEVILTIECKKPTKATLELSYYVSNAGWIPSYDIRAKSISDPVELAYKANIIQNTKENWKNVKLKVSSADPNLKNIMPKLKTYFLNYYSQPPRYDANDLSNQVKGKILDASSSEELIGVSINIKGTTIGTYSDVEGNFALTIPAGSKELEINSIGYQTKTIPISNQYMNIYMEESNNILSEVVVTGLGYTKTKVLEGKLAGVSVNEKSQTKNIPLPVIQIENQTSVEFEIKTPYTILSENKNTTIEMERYSLSAEYEYYCTPKIDKDAFLFANISDWEQYNLLEGEANIFFENTFIGKTILDTRYVTDTLNISLGRDRSISVQRDKVKEYTTRKIFGSKTETTRTWKINVKNNKRQPISMVLSDQIPISTMQEIEVNAENLSGGTLDNDTGEVKWKFTMQPSSKNELELKYKVKYPKGKTLNVE